MKVSRSGFYAWNRRAPSATAGRRQTLCRQVRRAFDASGRIYGSRRVAADLRAGGTHVCRNTVARLMRQDGLQSVVRRKRRLVPRTTDSKHDHPLAADLLGRDFAADAPDRKWAADITYIPTAEGFLYLAAVMDCFSRRIVGWNMLDHLKGELVRDASRMALLTRTPSTKDHPLIHHSDRGSQYASEDYRHLLQSHGIECSMSGKGDCWDNAAMESFFATLKTELVNHERYETREEARASIFEYIEVFYNRQRLHSSLGYVSPEQFERSLN